MKMKAKRIEKSFLAAPPEYWELETEVIEKMTNKCGPNGPLNSLIPDHIFGLDVSEACNIHDYTFVKSRDQIDHYRSDILFLENQKRLIKSSKSGRYLRSLRYFGAYLYYFAVRAYSTFQ